MRGSALAYHAESATRGYGDTGKMEDTEEGPKCSKDSGKVKATAMSTDEMVEMVHLLEKYDYDGRLRNYVKPNARKDQIITKILHVLQKKYGVERCKEQVRKRWSDLKHREHEKLSSIHKILKKSEYCCFSTLYVVCTVLELCTCCAPVVCM